MTSSNPTSPNPVRYLFVYGTLRPGFDNPYARRLAGDAGYVAPATMQGRLYDVGRYPAVVRSEHPDDCVVGDLYHLPPSSGLLAWLDDYEGCGPRFARPHEYGREALTVCLPDGTGVIAWVYLFKRNVRRLRPIPSGDYRLSTGRRCLLSP